LAREASRGIPRTLTGASITFCSAVFSGKRLKDWKTMPMRWRRSLTGARGAVISSSPTKTRPASGRSSRFRQRSSVDLPEPDGPMTQTTWPDSTVRSTLARTVFSP
jgi:hypothetical protein